MTNATTNNEFDIANKITECFLWNLTQVEIVQYDENEDCLVNGGWGYHGTDNAPCDAEHVLDISPCHDHGAGTGDYLVATADDEAPEVAKGWEIEPVEIEAGYFDRFDGGTFCVMDHIRDNNHVIAFVC